MFIWIALNASHSFTLQSDAYLTFSHTWPRVCPRPLRYHFHQHWNFEFTSKGRVLNFHLLSLLVTILSPVRASVTHKELSFDINWTVFQLERLKIEHWYTKLNWYKPGLLEFKSANIAHLYLKLVMIMHV